MRFKKSLIEITHDEGYADDLIGHINNALKGKDMRAERIVGKTQAFSLEGIPDGWDPVRVGRPVAGEFFINGAGKVVPAGPGTYLDGTVIVRKIEKPKQYRHFANAAEADPMRNVLLRFKTPAIGEEDSKFRVVFLMSKQVGIGPQVYSYEEAFNLFQSEHGDPFGVKLF